MSPDTELWLANGLNAVVVTLDRRTADSYSFDASSGQQNYCIPDTSGNNKAADHRIRGQSEVLRHGGAGLCVQCTHGSGTAVCESVRQWNLPAQRFRQQRAAHATQHFAQEHAGVSGAGPQCHLRANGAVSTDYYVRDGGDGSCTLP
jgi:hypothetical protein